MRKAMKSPLLRWLVVPALLIALGCFAFCWLLGSIALEYRRSLEYRCCPLPLSTTFHDETSGKRITVKEKLKELGAHCESGQLYDRQGRPIYLYVRRTAENLSPG